MSQSLVITEGREDVHALREIFCRCFGMQIAGGRPQAFHRGTALQREERVLHIGAAGGREQAALRTAEALEEYATSPYDRVGMVFDPDRDDDDTWREWFSRAVIGDRPSAWDETGLHIAVEVGDQQVPLVPAPWDAGPIFDELPEDPRTLERVGLAIATEGAPESAGLVDELLATLRDRGQAPGWKTAYRLLHAVHAPGRVTGFTDRLFGQDRDLRPHVAEVLKTTHLFARLAFLAGREHGAR